MSEIRKTSSGPTGPREGDTETGGELGRSSAPRPSAYETQLLAVITDPESTCDDVAEVYREGILQNLMPAGGWGRVNEAIAERWTWSALTYVKKEAWRGVY